MSGDGGTTPSFPNASNDTTPASLARSGHMRRWATPSATIGGFTTTGVGTQQRLGVALANGTVAGALSAAEYLLLKNTTGVQATHNAHQSIPHGAFTTLAFNQHINGPVGDAGVHSTTVNNPNFIATRAGWWRLEASVVWAPSATGVRLVAVLHSALAAYIAWQEVPTAGGVNNTATSVAMTSYYGAAGYATVQVYQDSGAALNVLSGAYYSPDVTWVYIGD